jgi:hypothetical protein
VQNEVTSILLDEILQPKPPSQGCWYVSLEACDPRNFFGLKFILVLYPWFRDAKG